MDMTYTMKDGYRLPDLLPPQEPETTLGKYGLLRRKYLKAHRKVLFTNLLTSGKLNEHLAEIDRTAKERMEQLVTEMARTEGVTEELKAADPMKWLGLMNSLRNAAEETVLTELIYNRTPNPKKRTVRRKHSLNCPLFWMRRKFSPSSKTAMMT